MREINVVVGFTPYQSYVAETFIDSLDGDTYFYFTKRSPRCNSKRIGIEGWGFFSFLVYVFFLRFNFFFGRKVNFYFPHPMHLATNYPVFSGKCFTLNVYEEGIANYYDADKELWVISFCKKAFLYVLGFPFQTYSGHLVGCDEVFIDSCLCADPKKLAKVHRFGKVVQLDFSQGASVEFEGVRDKSKVLFLDQPLKIGKEERYALNLKVLEALGSYKRVCYKGHHDYDSLLSGFEPIELSLKGEPAEKVIASDDFGIVVSFHSSALVNISRLFPDVECYSIHVDGVEVSVNGEFISTSEFLRTFGVSVICDE